MIDLPFPAWIEKSPHLWRNLQLLRYRNSRFIGQLVSPNHHLVLEGFPRSGNSYSVRVFLNANGCRRTWSIAHHFHRLPQVTLGVRWERPSIVLVRRPDDAVLSLVAHSIMRNVIPAEGRSLHLRYLTRAFGRWSRFYQGALEVRENIIISDFSATTERLDRVFAATNERFGTDFCTSLPTEAERKAIFDTGGTHLSPNALRSNIKDRLTELIQDRGLQKQRDAASQLYDQVKKFSIVAD